jgi:hypothetical protein
MIERTPLQGKPKKAGLLGPEHNKTAPKKKKKKKAEEHPSDVAYGKALQAKWASKRGNP